MVVVVDLHDGSGVARAQTFDIEAAFLYPWAVIYRDAAQGPSGMFLFGEMAVFIGLLAVGYVYVWKKKAFDWH